MNINLAIDTSKIHGCKNFKSAFYAVSLILILILSVGMLMNTSVVKAQTSVPTVPYLSIEPNPVGVNQTVDISGWMMPLPPTGLDFYHSVTVEMTTPSGNVVNTTQNTYLEGTYYFAYTPTTTGNYSFQAIYPGEYFADASVTYAASVSPVTTLVVQSAPITMLPLTPLPTGYWTSPVNGQNYLWSAINGNWLMAGYNSTQRSWVGAASYNPYSQAVGAPHVMWTSQLGLGGIVGGDLGWTSYYSGLSYESYLTPPIIMDGILYYNVPLADNPQQSWAAVNLQTGKVLYTVNGASITLGQTWNYLSGNQWGPIPYLWTTGGTYQLWNPQNGNLICSFANASTGTVVMDSVGAMYVYLLGSHAQWFAMWNETLCFQNCGFLTDFAANEPGNPTMLRVGSGTYNWQSGIQWNVTAPNALNMTLAGATSYATGLVTVTGDDIVYLGGPNYGDFALAAAYSLTTGQRLWQVQRPANGNEYDGWVNYGGNGIYVQFNSVGENYIAYSASTGAQLWVSAPAPYPWGDFTTRHEGLIANGFFYTADYSGTVTAYNAATGTIAWRWTEPSSGLETPYNSYPFFGGLILAGGLLYIATGEHSPDDPYYIGEALYALNANSGVEAWNMTGYWVIRALADGYLAAYNAYDNNLYVIGKGLSATTVTTSPVLNNPAQVLIKGTVTDQSSGQTCLGIPAAGTPAISDQYMGQWMEYLYQQQPEPMNATGVPVTLTYVDPNGNSGTIGTTTSDITGQYSYTFTPTLSGTYKIIATFGGSNSYGGSTAQTILAFGQPAATSAPTASPTSVADTYFMPAIGGLFVLVIIVAIVLALLMLRKRP